MAIARKFYEKVAFKIGVNSCRSLEMASIPNLWRGKTGGGEHNSQNDDDETIVSLLYNEDL